MSNNGSIFLVGYHITCAGRFGVFHPVDDFGNVTVDETKSDHQGTYIICAL